MGNAIHYAAAPTTFSKEFRVSSAYRKQKEEHLENCGKIILPPSALYLLGQLNIQWPILFQVSATSLYDSMTRITHCGVLEFTSSEGEAILPSWMMRALGVRDDDIICVAYVTLPLGTFVRLQPHHHQSFQQLSNPKVILEKGLRNFSALTVGQEVPIVFGSTTYVFTVLDVKPENSARAISIIETDLDLDLAPALDAPPEEVSPSSSAIIPNQSSSASSFLSSSPADPSFLSQDVTLTPVIETSVHNTKDTSLTPFSGTARSLRSSSSSSSISQTSISPTSSTTPTRIINEPKSTTATSETPSSPSSAIDPFSGPAFQIKKGKVQPSSTPSTSSSSLSSTTSTSSSNISSSLSSTSSSSSSNISSSISQNQSVPLTSSTTPPISRPTTSLSSIDAFQGEGRVARKKRV